MVAEQGNMTRARKKTDRNVHITCSSTRPPEGQGRMPLANERFPPMTPSLFEPLLRRLFVDGSISERTSEAAEGVFRRVAKGLLPTDRIGGWSG
jgi:hypothetical protein